MDTKTIEILIFILFIAIIILGNSGRLDKDDALIEHKFYCEMVALWNANKHLAPEQRPGWPPYKGECDETPAE